MLQARHEEQGKCFLFFEVLSFDAMILAGFLNYLGGQRVYKRLCGSNPRFAGKLGAMS